MAQISSKSAKRRVTSRNWYTPTQNTICNFCSSKKKFQNILNKIKNVHNRKCEFLLQTFFLVGYTYSSFIKTYPLKQAYFPRTRGAEILLTPSLVYFLKILVLSIKNVKCQFYRIWKLLYNYQEILHSIA